MQFSKIAVSTAFLSAALASAAPIAFSKAAAIQPEARTADQDVLAEKRLNPAFMIGNVAGSILPELFGSKEAADEFVAKLQASQNSNSTSGIEARGGKTDIGGLIAAGINLLNTLGARDVDEESAQKRLNPAFMIGSVGGSVLSSIFGSKEAADAYLAQIKSSQSQSQPAARDVDPSPEKRLGWAKAGQAAAGAVLGWLQSKEGQEWAASKEGQDLLSKAAATPIQSRDVAEMEERAGKIGTAAGWGAGINIANAILNVLKPDDQQKRSIVNGNLDLDLLGPFIHPAIKFDA